MPQSTLLYVPSITAPLIVKMVKQFWFQFPEKYRHYEIALHLPDPDALPITKPPYGRVTAIDLKTGNRLWMQPMGNGPRSNPAIRSLKLGRIGWPYRGFPLVTKTLLFIAQEGSVRNEHVRPGQNGIDAEFDSVDPTLQVFDKTCGRLLTEVPLPSNASGSPLTYMYQKREYIVMAIGGGNIPAELVALALPK